MELLTLLKAAVFKMKKSKKGAVFVEAALIFPLLISIVILVIGYAYQCCDYVCSQSESHKNERESAIITGELNGGEGAFARKIDALLEAIK
jgi:hypothetical protein